MTKNVKFERFGDTVPIRCYIFSYSTFWDKHFKHSTTILLYIWKFNFIWHFSNLKRGKTGSRSNLNAYEKCGTQPMLYIFLFYSLRETFQAFNRIVLDPPHLHLTLSHYIIFCSKVDCRWCDSHRHQKWSL